MALSLEGAMDIASAAELKERLVEVLNAGLEVRVSLAGATALDVTAVELLWAAAREAKQSGLGFLLAEPIPEEISGALVAAGLQTFLAFPVAGQDSGVIPCQP